MLRSSLALALLLTLSACDSGLDIPPGSVDDDCVRGAALTATIGGGAFTGICVEVSESPTTVLVSSVDADGAATAVRSVEVLVNSREAGTFAIPAGNYVSVTTRQRVNGAVTRTTRVNGGSGAIVVAEASETRVRGTFETVGRESITDAAGTTVDGELVTVSGSFDVPR